MRKLSIILLLLFALTLVGCKKDTNIPGKKADISIKEQSLVDNVYTFKLELGTEYDQEDRNQIFFDSASSLYLEVKDAVGLKKHILNISFSYKDTSYGSLMFAINNSIEEPGLKLLTNNLK